MSIKPTVNHRSFLNLVEKPSRYLGTEINAVHKDPATVATRIVLAFPDLYEIGTSHFGLQILYHLLNRQDHIVAERVFAPASDMEKHLRTHDSVLASLESGTAISQFDIIGFSLLYELNYTNVINMIDLARLPIYAEQRLEDHPFIIAGGPCVCNPEPMADFFDAMVFGDGEDVFLEMVELWRTWKKNSTGGRMALLTEWSRLEGVYIPQFFDVSYDNNGFQHLTPRMEHHAIVRRRIVQDLDSAYFPDQPVIAFNRPIHDRLRLEISRGCTRGCRFCQAGMIYRPVRERSPDTLLNLCRRSLAATGYEDLSLLSLSTGDYTCLSSFMENLMTLCRKDRVAVSLPSIRAGTLNPGLMQMIQTVRKTGFTIAPEAGSQRLRDAINKNINYDDIAKTVEDAFSLGWKVIKLYFMIGLPTESDEDIEAIGQMVQQLKQIRGGGRKSGRLNVSVTSFIPKPHTPFQWANQISKKRSEIVIDYLKNRFKRTSVHFKWQNPGMSILEGALARGDRRLGRVVYNAWRCGCLFDGWSDHFDFTKWEKAFTGAGVQIDDFTVRERRLDEPLPWRHMDSRVRFDFLTEQWEAAQNGQKISDCRYDHCHQCGTCDFSSVQPRLYHQCPAMDSQLSEDFDHQNSNDHQKVIKELIYSKMDQARYFGHLELANIFARALRRSEIPVDYTRGFHPMPRLSFDDPLPVGMESQAERVRIHLVQPLDDGLLISRINTQLPIGLQIRACRPYSRDSTSTEPGWDTYQVLSDRFSLAFQKIAKFLDNDFWPFEKTRAKGKRRQIDLRAAVKEMAFFSPSVLKLVIHRNKQFAVRPADVLISVFEVPADQIPLFRITKTAEWFDPKP